MVRFLLDHGGDANSLTEVRHESVLHWAVGAGEIEIARALLAAGAHVHAIDENRFTPLHWSAFHSDAAMARLLLDHGADPNAEDARRRTPLYWAQGKFGEPTAAVITQAGGELRAEQVLPPRRFHDQRRELVPIVASKASFQANRSQCSPLANIPGARSQYICPLGPTWRAPPGLVG